MKINLKTVTLLLLLVCLGFFGVKSLFSKGYYTSHDGWHQVARLYYYDKTIKEAIFPPRYITNLFFGYGYPLFIFNYHLPWLVAEPFMYLGFSVFDSIKTVYILGYVLSGITMFVWLRRFGNIEAFVGAFLYMWAPYRFSNIFVRGAIGEASVFIFLPLLFLAFDLAKKRFNWTSIFIGAVSIAGIILSHAIVAFLVLSLSSFYVLFSLPVVKKQLHFVLRLIILTLLGLLLASYYLVPSLTLKKYTKFDERIQATKNEGQFATFKELIYSKWGYGFAVPRGSDSMSFQLGIAQWCTIFLLFITLIYFFIRRRKIQNIDFIISLSVIFVLSIILITPQSQVIWKKIIDQLFIVDFPWRLLTISVFTSSALSAYLLFILPKKMKFFLLFLLLLVAFYTNRNYLRVNQYTEIPLSLYLASENTTNTYDEYLPQWVNSEEIKKLNLGGKIISNNSQITGVENKTSSLAFNYKSGQAEDFTIHLFYFPGWEAFIDSKKIEIKKNNLGLINFSAPEGTHRVFINYTGTNLTKISNFLSLLTILILIFGFFVDPKKLFK